jgi:hypothetical protein
MVLRTPTRTLEPCSEGKRSSREKRKQMWKREVHWLGIGNWFFSQHCY